MRSHVPAQPYPVGGTTVQFWRSVDNNSDNGRRILLMATPGSTSRSSPGPTSRLSHRSSPTTQSAPVSPAPSGSHPPSAIRNIPQPSNTRPIAPHLRNRASQQPFHEEPQPGMGPRQGSLPGSDDFTPPLLPPRRNPPPPPPRSGSGLCPPSQPPLFPEQGLYSPSSLASAANHHRSMALQHLLVDPRAPIPSALPINTPNRFPDTPSEFVDMEVTNGLLRLLFARFADAGDASGTPDLRRIVAHLVRIAHTDVVIQSPSLQASPRCPEATMGPGGGLLEKMEVSLYDQLPIAASGHLQNVETFGPSLGPLKSDENNDDNADETASSSSSDSVNSSDNEMDEGGDFDVYEGISATVPPGNSQPLKSSTRLTHSGSSTHSGVMTVPPPSTTLLTVAELHALPQNTTIKCLRASAMQALSMMVSAYQLDPSLRQRDLEIAQLLSRIQVYTMTQSERVCAARAAGGVGEGRLSPDDGHRVAPTYVPVPEVASLVRLSFHTNHRQAICDLGGLHALLSLLRWDHAWWQVHSKESHRNLLMDSFNLGQVHSTTPPNGPNLKIAPPLDYHSTTATGGERVDGVSVAGASMTTAEASLALRRYICVALTNLTFRSPVNKSFVCKRRGYLEALIAQLEIGSEELKQVAASVMRNLGWHTDARSKAALRKTQAAVRLTRAVVSAQRESTLRTTLSALWNLSSHSTANKKAVCSVNGALAFLVSTLDVKSPIKDLEIKANIGGVLRNLCSVIVNSLEYRAVLRTHNCCAILLEQLRTSPSVTVVVNVCEVLSALSVTPPRDGKPSCGLLFESASADQALMIRLGALDILHRLAHSRHHHVVTTSKHALENLERAHMLIRNQRVVPYPTNPESMYTPATTADGSPVTSNQSSPGSSSPASPAEQVYRRRMSNRSHLRFGLLSVVLETNDDFEEEEEEEDDDEEEEDDDADSSSDDEIADEADCTPEEERSTECSSKVSQAGGEEEADFKLPEYPPTPTDHVDVSPPPPPPPPPLAYAQTSIEEDEQACVYAEEGTPFGPSARASVLDLHSPAKQETSAPVYDNLLTSPRQSVHPYVNVDVPLKGATAKPVASSGVSSPGFDSSSNAAVLETPMMFSRTTSSCISSLDLGPLPPIESSPESIYSTPTEEGEGDAEDEIALGTSPSDLPVSFTTGLKKPSKPAIPEKIAGVLEEEETQIMFAEEGSPLDNNSLSGDDNDSVIEPSMWGTSKPTAEASQSSHKILQQCIASVMPTTLSNAPIQSAVSYAGDNATSFAVVAPTTTEDTIQSFAVEGTPFAFSTKNSSFSDVSITDPEEEDQRTSASSSISKCTSPRQSMIKADAYTCSEDAISVNEVEEDGSVNLLSEVIQSALPKQGRFSSTMKENDANSGSNPSMPSLNNGPRSKLASPQFGFGRSLQQRRPQATVAPMPQCSKQESPPVQTSGNIKSEVKPSSDSDTENSSFSSLLSIESVGVETSLLQECISSAMPIPKVPILTPCHGVGGPPQDRSYPLVLEAPATAPITAPVSPYSSHSQSPLAVSEITANQKQIPQPKRSTVSGSGSGLRRAGHFLAHGSGPADALNTSRPEKRVSTTTTNTTITTTPLKNTINSSHPPVKKTILSMDEKASSVGSTAAPALRAPRSMSGCASRSAKTADISNDLSASTAVLRPFGDHGLPLPFYPDSLDAEDDTVTLVGDSSPPWRPSSPPTPSANAVGTTQIATGGDFNDDGLLDLDALMCQPDTVQGLLSTMPQPLSKTTNKSAPSSTTTAIPERTVQAGKSIPNTKTTSSSAVIGAIRPPNLTSNSRLASPVQTQLKLPSGLRRPSNPGVPGLSRSTLSLSSSTSSTSSSSLTSSSHHSLTRSRPSSAVSSSPVTRSGLHQLTNQQPGSSLTGCASSPRLLTKHSTSTRFFPTQVSSSSLLLLSSSSSSSSGATVASHGSLLLPSPAQPTASPSYAKQPSRTPNGSAPRVGHNTTTATPGLKPPSKVGNVKKTQQQQQPVPIRTGARGEVLAEERKRMQLQEDLKGIKGGSRKLQSSLIRKSNATSTPPPPQQQRVSHSYSAKPSESSKPATMLVYPKPSTDAIKTTSARPSSGLKPPGFLSSSAGAIKPPQATRLVKPLTKVLASDQWIVRRELTN